MDIDNQLKENIKEEMLLLPKETQEVINSFKFKEIFTEISKAHKFSEDETKKLEVETILIIIGLVDFKLFVQNISDNIEISEQEALEIEKEVTQKIFNPLCEQVNEKVKQNILYKKQDWRQTIYFIISGGNYSSFIGETIIPTVIIKPSSVKSNFSI